MKAVILAAGKGERLKKITRDIPKPMIRFLGKPILQHNIEQCREFGITRMFINTHHLPEVIRDYFGDGSKFGVSITYSFEPELLGTAGALMNFRKELEGENFFVIYGDNFSRYNLRSLVDKFQRQNSLGVIAFHFRKDTSSSGVGEFDPQMRILRFLEKPKAHETESHWVNAGIYYFSPAIFQYITPGFLDFAMDIFPKLLRDNLPLYAVCEESEVIAFDTPEMYRASIHDTIRK